MFQKIYNLIQVLLIHIWEHCINLLLLEKKQMKVVVVWNLDHLMQICQDHLEYIKIFFRIEEELLKVLMKFQIFLIFMYSLDLL